jgi:hypothetical protein
VEAVKLAGWLGELGAGRFEDWDLVDPPPAALLHRWSVDSVEEALGQCREALRRWDGKSAKEGRESAPAAPGPLIHCLRFGAPSTDALPCLLAACGIGVVSTDRDALPDGATAAYDALVPDQAEGLLQSMDLDPSRVLIFADGAAAGRLRRFGRIVAFPTTFGRLRECCRLFLDRPRPDEACAS